MRVLGSVSVEVDGRPVPVGGPAAAAACRVAGESGAVVSVDRLVEVLWGNTAQGGDLVVARLRVAARRLLPPSVRLETAVPGYRLRLEAGAADVERFEAALGEALACLADRPEAALAGLDEALGLRRGDALAEFA